MGSVAIGRLYIYFVWYYCLGVYVLYVERSDSIIVLGFVYYAQDGS